MSFNEGKVIVVLRLAPVRQGVGAWHVLRQTELNPPYLEVAAWKIKELWGVVRKRPRNCRQRPWKRFAQGVTPLATKCRAGGPGKISYLCISQREQFSPSLRR